MDDIQTQRKGKGRLVLGIVIGVVVVMAITAAVVLGVVFGMKKENKDELREIPVSEVPVFLAVQSFGTSNNMTTFTVQYRSKNTCTAERRSSQYGILEREVLNPQTNENGISTVRIQRHLSGGYVAVSVHCHRVSANIAFDSAALATPGLQTLANQTDELPFNLVNTVLDDVTGEYNVSLTINKENKIDYFFGGLNTSVSPSVPFEYIDFDLDKQTGKFRTTVAEKEGDLKEYSIVIDRELVNAGGILTINGITKVATNYVRDIHVGKSIHILSPITGETVPSGHSGFYPLLSGKTLDIYEDTYSLWCYLMGNPLPRVETYFRDQDNTTVEIESKEIRFDEYSLVAVSTVTKDAFSGGGAFICRARPGDEAFELYFKFKEFEQSVIDTNESGLIEQTSEKDVIRCVARGRPLPEINIRLYERYGPNLIDTGLFQVSMSNTNDTLASVTMTISPPNLDIHTVYCESQQVYNRQSDPSFHVIELYPGREDNYTLNRMMWDAIFN